MFTNIAAIQTSPNEPSMPIKLVNGSRNLAKKGIAPMSSRILIIMTTGKITLNKIQKILVVS